MATPSWMGISFRFDLMHATDDEGRLEEMLNTVCSYLFILFLTSCVARCNNCWRW